MFQVEKLQAKAKNVKIEVSEDEKSAATVGGFGNEKGGGNWLAEPGSQKPSARNPSVSMVKSVRGSSKMTPSHSRDRSPKKRKA